MDGGVLIHVRNRVIVLLDYLCLLGVIDLASLPPTLLPATFQFIPFILLIYPFYPQPCMPCLTIYVHLKYILLRLQVVHTLRNKYNSMIIMNGNDGNGNDANNSNSRNSGRASSGNTWATS